MELIEVILTKENLNRAYSVTTATGSDREEVAMMPSDRHWNT
ncbi:MAG: hypothetical protein ACLROL_05090 [Sellimonas sp.]